ncbi:PEROXIDASE 25-RELATED [Salix viminalis]|uniref:Peroxidase n=1 Tax=Salix viminalis TaxID=40686 RepID=A0A9Q0Z816_SALVM|nr:PEROXIDASE 25-RELATED [Salix viminalis]
MPSSSSSNFLLSFLFALTASNCAAKNISSSSSPRQLSVDYYAKTCPQLELLVGSVTSQQFKEAPVSGPATIRLFFHDCFVEGCDASILISTTPGSKVLAEKDAEDNQDLRAEGFQTAGGPYYPVKKGRRDGKISMASRVPYNIPRANFTIDQQLKLFNSKGLALQDLVVLSGAHTFGFAHCKQFVSRLYTFRGTNQPDPDMDPRLLKSLRMSCPQFGGSSDIVAPFDVTTPFLFDHAYYGNLEAKLGLLASDQALFSDPRTKPLVLQLGKDKKKFFQAFSAAMEKMGSIGVETGTRQGEKRRESDMQT